MNVENANYRNKLPISFSSWTELYLELDLASIVHLASAGPKVKELRLNFATFPEGKRDQNGILDLDLDFLKARLFDEFFLSSSVTKRTTRTIRAIAFTHQDQSPLNNEDLKSALNEIHRLGKLVSKAREEIPTVIDLSN